MTSIKQPRYKLGWRQTGPGYCQIVRETNRAERLAFAKRCMVSSETFVNVVFTEEITIRLERHGRICFTKKRDASQTNVKSQIPIQGRRLWAGISTRRATPIVVFTRIIRKEFYTEAILKDNLLLFVINTF